MLPIVIIVGLVVFLFLVFALDSVFGGLDFETGSLAADKVVKIIKQRHLGNGNFYDLGSCRGDFAIKMAEAFPMFSIYGIDDNWFRILSSRIRSIFLKNVKFRKENFFKTDVSSADIIYLYLPQELMLDLQNKLQKESKPEALVITASVSFPSWQPAQIYDIKDAGLKVPKFFVYIKN